MCNNNKKCKHSCSKSCSKKKQKEIDYDTLVTKDAYVILKPYGKWIKGAPTKQEATYFGLREVNVNKNLTLIDEKEFPKEVEAFKKAGFKGFYTPNGVLNEKKNNKYHVLFFKEYV